MDIQCSAVVVCNLPGQPWPQEAGGRRVVAGYANEAPADMDPELVCRPRPRHVAGTSPAAVIMDLADEHRGEAVVLVLTPAELEQLLVPPGTAIIADSEGFVPVS